MTESRCFRLEKVRLNAGKRRLKPPVYLVSYKKCKFALANLAGEPQEGLL
jgi:hypothetical protein